MAKAWTNSRWTLNWKGIKTGYLYRLVITPSDTTDISPVDIELPSDCILDYEYTWQYDKYPIGLYDAPILDLTFKIDKCPADFAKALYNPFADFDYTPASTALFTMRAGNIFTLYIAYDGINYKKQYIGVQQSGGENEFDFDSKECKVETIDINYFILSSIPTTMLDLSLLGYTSSAVCDECYNDWFYTYSGSYRFTRSCWRKNPGGGAVGGTTIRYFWFLPISLLFYCIEAFSLWATRKLIRNASETNPLCSFYKAIYAVTPTDSTGYYRQNFTGDGSRGARLVYTEIYILAYINTDTTTTNWLLWVDGEDYGVGGYIEAIKKEYKTCWDFMKDYLKEHLVKAFTNIDNSGSPPVPRQAYLDFTTMYVADYLDFTNVILINPRLESYEILKKVEGITIDKVEETIDKITATSPANKNENSLSVNHTVLNTPCAVTMKDHIIFNNQGNSSWTDKINNTEIFYFDDTYGSTRFNQMHRVHEKIKFAVSDTLTTDDFVTTADFDLNDTNIHPAELQCAPSYDPVKDGKGSGNITRQTIAESTGKLKIVTEFLLDIYGDKNQYNLSAKTTLDKFQISTHVNNVFTPTCEIYYPLSNIEPHSGMFSEISNRFVIMSIKLDKDENVEFEAITRRKDTVG